MCAFVLSDIHLIIVPAAPSRPCPTAPPRQYPFMRGEQQYKNPEKIVKRLHYYTDVRADRSQFEWKEGSERRRPGTTTEIHIFFLVLLFFWLISRRHFLFFLSHNIYCWKPSLSPRWLLFFDVYGIVLEMGSDRSCNYLKYTSII